MYDLPDLGPRQSPWTGELDGIFHPAIFSDSPDVLGGFSIVRLCAGPCAGRLHAFSPSDYGLTAILQHGWHPALINLLVPGGWSIAVEGTFYLLASFLYQSIRNWRAALWFLLGSVALSEATYQMLAFLYEEHLLFVETPINQIQTYVYAWFPAQLPVFVCGILVYHLGVAQEKRKWGRPDGRLLLVTSGVALLTAINIGKHGWISQHLFFALGFVPLMLGLRIYPLKLLVNAFTRLLGKVSYSAYLLHFAVLQVAATHLFRLIPPMWQGGLAAFLLLFAVTLFLTLPVAWLTHRYVEQAFIHLGAKLIRRMRASQEVGAGAGELIWRGSSAE